MAANIDELKPRNFGIRAATCIGIAALAFAILGGGGASAYIGESFLGIPGLVGGTPSKDYRNWLRIEGHYWKSQDDGGIFGGRRNRIRRQRNFFSNPPAPRQGADELVIAIDKRNPALRQLMDKCASKAAIPEMTFAESSVRARGLAELGPRPADIPAFYEYKLKEVQVSDCPVVADAPEQAIVLSFKNIEWLNYQAEGDGKDVKLVPASLTLRKTTGATQSFVVSWFAVAHDVSDDQCAKVNAKPTEDDYYAFMSKEAADKERAELVSKGGVNYESGQMGRRGPNKLNACLLPGILKDPGLVVPQTKIARGLNLDGDDGTGRPPAGVCRHKNYLSSDGQRGIDNQLYSVQGCMPGYQGHKGFLMQYRNEQRRNGLLSILVQIRGIDDEKNDNSVEVLVLYSKDPMAKSADGQQILHDYTYRLTDNVEFTHYYTRLQGRIINGVIVTDPVKTFQMHPGIDPELTLYEARMRLQIMPDGKLKGIIGGYEDWRKLMALNANSNSESLYGFQCPAMYNAFKRQADGLKDPVTGECNGISSAYDIEGSPAFIPPAQNQALIAQAGAPRRKAP